MYGRATPQGRDATLRVAGGVENAGCVVGSPTVFTHTLARTQITDPFLALFHHAPPTSPIHTRARKQEGNAADASADPTPAPTPTPTPRPTPVPKVFNDTSGGKPEKAYRVDGNKHGRKPRMSFMLLNGVRGAPVEVETGKLYRFNLKKLAGMPFMIYFDGAPALTYLKFFWEGKPIGGGASFDANWWQNTLSSYGDMGTNECYVDLFIPSDDVDAPEEMTWGGSAWSQSGKITVTGGAKRKGNREARL